MHRRGWGCAGAATSVRVSRGDVAGFDASAGWLGRKETAVGHDLSSGPWILSVARWALGLVAIVRGCSSSPAGSPCAWAPGRYQARRALARRLGTHHEYAARCGRQGDRSDVPRAPLSRADPPPAQAVAPVASHSTRSTAARYEKARGRERRSRAKRDPASAMLRASSSFCRAHSTSEARSLKSGAVST